MPNKKAQEKHERQSKKRNLRNRQLKSSLYTTIRKARTTLETANVEEVKEIVPKAIKTINKSAQKGIIHKKKAARLQSRMAKTMNKLTKLQETPKPETN